MSSSKRTIEIYVGEDRSLFDEAVEVLGVKSYSQAVKEALRIAVEQAKGISPDEFARELGYANWTYLMHASELVENTGGVCKYVTRLPHGVWAVWDDKKLSKSNVRITDTRENAIKMANQ